MKNLFLFLFVAIAVTACKKNSDDAPQPPGGGGSSAIRIKSVTYSNGVEHLTYDAQGRIILDVDPDGSKEEYEYLPGIVNEKVYAINGDYKYSYKNELNSDGEVTRTTRSDFPANEELLYYNPDKSLTKRISKSNGFIQTTDYFYSNGNCDSLRFSSNGQWNSTIVKTFYADKLNNISMENFGFLFYGKQDKNLQKSEEYKYPDGSSNGIETYVYEFDQQGRITKLTSTHNNNIYISLYTY